MLQIFGLAIVAGNELRARCLVLVAGHPVLSDGSPTRAAFKWLGTGGRFPRLLDAEIVGWADLAKTCHRIREFTRDRWSVRSLWELFQGFAMSMNRRDTFVDGIRGLALVVICLNHIPSPITPYTFESLGFFSAAEVFVFISGFVAGFVYAPSHRGIEPRKLRIKAWRRTGILWCAFVLAFGLSFFIRSWGGVGAGGWRNILERPFLRAWGYSGLLLLRPNFVGILPVYIVCMALTPVAISLLEQRRYDILYVACAGIWLFGQFGGSHAIEGAMARVTGVGAGHFDIFGWQALFFLGLFFGHRRGPCFDVPSDRESWWIVYLPMVATGLLFILKHGWFGGESLSAIPPWLTARQSLGPLRLVNSLVFLALVFRCSRVPVVRVSVRPFAHLGRASLQVFIAHDLLAAIMTHPAAGRVHDPIRILVVVISIGCLYGVAWATHFCKTWLKERKNWRDKGSLSGTTP